MDVFPLWRRAQLEVVGARARPRLRRPCCGLLSSRCPETLSGWPTGSPRRPRRRPMRSGGRRALERETARLFDVARHDLGVHMKYIHAQDGPYASAADLGAEIR